MKVALLQKDAWTVFAVDPFFCYLLLQLNVVKFECPPLDIKNPTIILCIILVLPFVFYMLLKIKSNAGIDQMC